nr:hypothetical protein [Tanacetum cinerariifolium]
MAALNISILFDSSEESVGSRAPQVILFGAIPAIIPEVPIVPVDPLVAPKVGTVSVVSLAGVLDLVDYSSSSDSDPSKDFYLPIRRRPGTHIRPGETIPFGRLYRTHSNRLRKLLTARKRVGPIPARRLAWRVYLINHRIIILHQTHLLLESVGSRAPQVILFGAIPAIIPEVPIVPVDPLVAPKVGTVSVVSLAGVLDLVDYSSSSDSDPSKDFYLPIRRRSGTLIRLEESVRSIVTRVFTFSTISTEVPIILDIPTDLPSAPELPVVSPFLCLDDSEFEPANELPARHMSLRPYDGGETGLDFFHYRYRDH